MRRIKALIKKIRNKEQGAIVAEATIALTAFVFAIYLILSIVDICYVQAKMGVALNSAAKEMSQYAYLYETFNLSEYMSGTGGKSSDMMKSFAEVLNKISAGTSNFSEDISKMFATGAEKAEGDSAAEYLKNGVGMAVAKQCVKKNLVSHKGDTPDAFLHRCHVKDGWKGLSFLNATFLTDANQAEISLIVSYKVEVVRLLDTEYTFNFVQRAETKAWGKGVSLKNGDEAPSGKSIWDIGPTARGDSIIAAEKKKFKYSSSDNGFHAYDPKKNQFIRIRSLDTFSASYVNNASNIEDQINLTYKELQKAEDLEKNISLTDSSGKDVTLTSNKGTRTYKIILVVPTSADKTTVNTAIANFKAKNPGVDVEFKAGYGDPANAKSPETEKTETEG